MKLDRNKGPNMAWHTGKTSLRGHWQSFHSLSCPQLSRKSSAIASVDIGDEGICFENYASHLAFGAGTIDGIEEINAGKVLDLPASGGAGAVLGMVSKLTSQLQVRVVRADR